MCCDFLIIIRLCEGMLQFQPGTNHQAPRVGERGFCFLEESVNYEGGSALSPPVRRDYWAN